MVKETKEKIMVMKCISEIPNTGSNSTNHTGSTYRKGKGTGKNKKKKKHVRRYLDQGKMHDFKNGRKTARKTTPTSLRLCNVLTKVLMIQR